LGSNIEHVTVDDRHGGSSMLDFVILVQDRQHLARIMRRLRNMSIVNRIYRPRP